MALVTEGHWESSGTDGFSPSAARNPWKKPLKTGKAEGGRGWCPWEAERAVPWCGALLGSCEAPIPKALDFDPVPLLGLPHAPKKQEKERLGRGEARRAVCGVWRGTELPTLPCLPQPLDVGEMLLPGLVPLGSPIQALRGSMEKLHLSGADPSVAQQELQPRGVNPEGPTSSICPKLSEHPGLVGSRNGAGIVWGASGNWGAFPRDSDLSQPLKVRVSLSFLCAPGEGMSGRDVSSRCWHLL